MARGPDDTVSSLPRKRVNWRMRRKKAAINKLARIAGK
jgi:hypothetical protein